MRKGSKRNSRTPDGHEDAGMYHNKNRGNRRKSIELRYYCHFSLPRFKRSWHPSCDCKVKEKNKTSVKNLLKKKESVWLQMQVIPHKTAPMPCMQVSADLGIYAQCSPTG